MAGNEAAATEERLRRLLRGYHDSPVAHTSVDSFSWTDADWQGVLALAEQERVVPLLYRACAGSNLPPGWLLDDIRGRYLQEAAISLLRSRELNRILSQLAQTGMEARLLKGLMLGELVYKNPALRPMVDMDLLIRKSELEGILRALSAAGYNIDMDHADPDYVMAYENAVTLSRRSKRTWFLELHWSLFDSPYHQERLSESTLWERAVEFQVDSQPAATLNAELTLLHLAGHLMLHHQGRGMLWWHDIAELLYTAGETMDWQKMLALTRQTGLTAVMQAVAARLDSEWGRPFPPSVAVELSSRAPAVKELRVYEAMAGDTPTVGKRFLSDLTSFPDSRERLRFLRDNLFPPAPYMDRRYSIPHPALRPLYYPYRWLLGLSTLRPGRRGNRPES